MNDTNRLGRLGGTATVILLSSLLFYLPSILAIFNRNDEPLGWTIMSVVMATFYTAVFCTNYYLLVPQMLIRKDNKPLYFAANICLIVLICSFIPIWFETHGGFPHPRHKGQAASSLSLHMMEYIRFIIRDGIMMILSAALAYALRLSRERENVRRRELELNAERRDIELKSLKAQLNPHFLFNSLNNIYALIGFAPERAQKALHDLSNLLRYQIYDSSSPVVPLCKEICFISEYVELMRLRLNSNVRLSCKTPGNVPEDVHIAPLMLLTLVENAFKHLSSGCGSPFIEIAISTDVGFLVCEVSNSYSEAEKKKDTGVEAGGHGVGLANIRRQLGLLYPGMHSLLTTGHDGVFKATLSISIDALTK